MARINENFLKFQAGYLFPEIAGRVAKLLSRYGYRLGSLPENISADSMLSAMKQDKKRRRGALRFVLQRSFGDTLVAELNEDMVRRVLEAGYTS